MGMFRTMGLFAAGFTVALAIGEAKHPGSAVETVEPTVQAGAATAQGAGALTGQVLAATGPAVAGAKTAIETSGLGEMLTPNTIPPASQPDPEP